jgi:hypothetical protein
MPLCPLCDRLPAHWPDTMADRSGACLAVTAKGRATLRSETRTVLRVATSRARIVGIKARFPDLPAVRLARQWSASGGGFSGRHTPRCRKSRLINQGAAETLAREPITNGRTRSKGRTIQTESGNEAHLVLTFHVRGHRRPSATGHECRRGPQKRRAVGRRVRMDCLR